MRSIVIPLLIGLSASFRSRVELQAAIATRHHQLEVLHRRAVRPRLRPADRTGKLGREWARHSVCVGRRRDIVKCCGWRGQAAFSWTIKPSLNSFPSKT